MSGNATTVAVQDRWLLPDGVEELLPEAASRVEQLRRDLLDLYRCWGYELVLPPLIEYTESLLIGLGADLDLQTFKLTDQLSGRTLGIRPDITPQTARMDAHSLRREGPTRLCYAGSVVHTRPRSPFASRSPIQLGCELYGAADSDADIEIICLMLETLATAGVREVTLDLGHVGIFRELMSCLALDEQDQVRLFDALQEKSEALMTELLAGLNIDASWREILSRLSMLNGGVDVLDEAESLFAPVAPAAAAAVASLRAVATELERRCGALNIHFDLCELHGYHYHTGLVFAAYADGHGEAVANGGRYDDIGEVFGRARPATGFNTDLKTLLNLQVRGEMLAAGGIFVPHELVADSWSEISRLRAIGERVVAGMPGQMAAADCDRVLARDAGGWSVTSTD